MENFEIKAGEIAKLPMNLIDLDPDQPRKEVSEAYLEEFAEDIKSKGVLQAITVRANDDDSGRFTIVYGECRYRASKLAKKRQIPAVLDTINKNDLDRFISQVKENYYRKDLNQIEMAGVLKRLRDDFGMKSQKKIEEALIKHGIKNMSRSYIANTIRLLDLPESVQNKIAANTITPAHGKYILSAMVSDNVLKSIEEEIENDPEITTRELQEHIFYAFDEHHKCLDRRWETAFDYQSQCVDVSCPNMHKMTVENEARYFCLNNQCHEEKTVAFHEIEDDDENTAALHGEDDIEPKEVVVDENNFVDTEEQELAILEDYRLIEDANFEKQECIGCEHCHQVKIGDNGIASMDLKEACFHLPCWEEKTDDYFDLQAQHRHAKRSLLQSLRVQIAATLPTFPDLLQAVCAWTVSGRPTPDEDSAEFENWIDDDNELQEQFIEAKLTSLASFIQNVDNHGELIAQQVALQMEDDDILYMANFFDIKTDTYRINEEYIGHKTADQLVQLLLDTGIIDEQIKAEYSEKDLPELYQICLDSAADMSTPDDINTIWQSLTEENNDA